MIINKTQDKVNQYICLICFGRGSFDALTNKMRCTTKKCRKRTPLYKLKCMQGNNEEILNTLLIADPWMRGGRVGCLSGFFAVDRAQVASIINDFGI
ncbi:hypothetical protein COBT_001538, partial [Conglomerata obtusa]